MTSASSPAVEQLTQDGVVPLQDGLPVGFRLGRPAGAGQAVKAYPLGFEQLFEFVGDRQAVRPALGPRLDQRVGIGGHVVGRPPVCLAVVDRVPAALEDLSGPQDMRVVDVPLIRAGSAGEDDDQVSVLIGHVDQDLRAVDLGGSGRHRAGDDGEDSIEAVPVELIRAGPGAVTDHRRQDVGERIAVAMGDVGKRDLIRK